MKKVTFIPCYKAVVLFAILLLGGYLEISAQESAQPKLPLVVSVFNVGTLLPGSGAGLFTQPVHPGVSAGTEFRYNTSPQNQWFQTARIGFLYHHYAQTAVQLYTELGYRRQIWRGTAAELRLGGGYLHSFPGTEIFRLQDGRYTQKRNLGRPQAMAGGTFGLSYALPVGIAPRVFLDYQFYLQMPFVKSYVPLLPNTALHLGVAFPFFKTK